MHKIHGSQGNSKIKMVLSRQKDSGSPTIDIAMKFLRNKIYAFW